MPELPPRTPIAAAPLSVILIAEEGAAALEEVAKAWSAHLTQARPEHEIIVVVRNRKQGDLLQAPRLRTVKEEKPGFGAALRAGIREATHPLVLYLPGEPEWRPDSLQAFLDRIDRVDIVTGSRTGQAAPLPLQGLGWLYRLLVRVIFGIPLEPLPGWLGWRGYLYQRFVRIVFGLRLHDVDCPIKLCRRDILARIPIQSDSSFVHTELLAKANFLSSPVDEVAVPLPPTPASWRQDFWKVFNHPEFAALKQS